MPGGQRTTDDGRRTAALTLLAALVVLPPLGCDVATGELGPWTKVETRQFAVPLVAGRTAVEVRDVEQGWSERIVVESDGRRATGGVPVERPDATADPPVDAASAELFRVEAGASVPTGGTDVERAIACRDWVVRRTFGEADTVTLADGSTKRRHSGRKSDPLVSEDGRAVLADIDAGGNFNCLSVATVFYDAARALGLKVRRVELSMRHESPYEAHSTIEAWSEADARWVVMDPTFNCHYEVDGRLAGALEIHDALAARRVSSIRVVRAPDAVGPDPQTFHVNPLLYYRNVYVRVGRGGRLTRFDAHTPAAPVTVPAYLQTDSDEPFKTASDPLGVAEIRRGRAGDRLAYQALGGMLYVCFADGLFRYGASEVRTTAGLEAVFGPTKPALEADDPLLFAPEELAPNARLEDGDGDGAPDEWEVEGSPAISREAGGALLLEALAEPAALVLRAELAPLIPVAAFARLRVERGGATFELRNRRTTDATPLEPGPAATVSSRMMTTRKGPVEVRIALEPGARCAVERVSLRRALRLREWN